MNKFKKILLGTLSVLTLGLFVSTGAKVEASTVTTSYTVKASDFYGGDAPTKTFEDGFNKDTKTKASVLNLASTKKVTMSTEGGHFYHKIYDTENNALYTGLGIDSNCDYDADENSYALLVGTSTTFTFSLAANETASITYVGYASATGKQVKSGINGKKVLFKSGSTESAWNSTADYTITSNIQAQYEINKLYTFTVNGLSGNLEANSLEFGANSGFVELTISITAPVTKTNSEYIADAEAAINAIGTVAYTPESKELIDAATAAIDLCENGIDDISAEAKATYQAAVNNYNNLKEAAYESLSKSFSTNNDTTITSSEVTLTGDQQLGTSIFTATTGMRKKDAANLTIGTDSWSTRYYTNGNSTIQSDKDLSRAIYFTANKSGTLKIAATSQNANDSLRSIDLYNESYENIGSKSAQIADTQNSYIYFDIPSAGIYYIGSTSGVNFFYLEFMPNTTMDANDVSLIISAQSNEETLADSTKLRFIGEIRGVEYANVGEINKIEFTFTFNNSSRVCEVTKLYKSIINNGEALLPASDGTMYVVYQLNNINKTAYQSLALTGIKFTVTFDDGSKVCGNHVNITLPEKFTTVVA